MYYLDGRKELPGFASAFDPPSTRNFTGILRSCRDLYTEVAALLYSANQFVMHVGKASLEPLQTLSPTAVASLTSLKIVLNELLLPTLMKRPVHSTLRSGPTRPSQTTAPVTSWMGPLRLRIAAWIRQYSNKTWLGRRQRFYSQPKTGTSRPTSCSHLRQSVLSLHYASYSTA